MELEELKKQWAEMSKELEQQKIINRQIIEQSCKNPIKSAVCSITCEAIL